MVVFAPADLQELFSFPRHRHLDFCVTKSARGGMGHSSTWAGLMKDDNTRILNMYESPFDHWYASLD